MPAPPPILPLIRDLPYGRFIRKATLQEIRDAGLNDSQWDSQESGEEEEDETDDESESEDEGNDGGFGTATGPGSQSEPAPASAEEPTEEEYANVGFFDDDDDDHSVGGVPEDSEVDSDPESLPPGQKVSVCGGVVEEEVIIALGE